jgi:hypothetical protein
MSHLNPQKLHVDFKEAMYSEYFNFFHYVEPIDVTFGCLLL